MRSNDQKRSVGVLKHRQVLHDILYSDKFQFRVKKLSKIHADPGDYFVLHPKVFDAFMAELGVDESFRHAVTRYVLGESIDSILTYYGDESAEPCSMADLGTKYWQDYYGSKYDPKDQAAIHASMIEDQPVAILISPMATQRDVLDYVSRNWASIRTILNMYGGERKLNARKNQDFSDYVASFPDLPIANLIVLAQNEFPKLCVDYKMTADSRAAEKKRRER